MNNLKNLSINDTKPRAATCYSLFSCGSGSVLPTNLYTPPDRNNTYSFTCRIPVIDQLFQIRF